MRPTPSSSPAAELGSLIDQAVIAQAQADELDARLKGLRAAIKDLMQGAGLDRMLSAAGNEALLIERQSLSWKLGHLQETLSRAQFDELCPRKPDASALRQLLESGQGPEGLRGCAKGSKSIALELRAAPGSAPDSHATPPTSAVAGTDHPGDGQAKGNTNPPRAASFGPHAGDVAGRT